MYRAITLKNIDKYRNNMLILEYNFYNGKQKEKIMFTEEDFKNEMNRLVRDKNQREGQNSD